MKGINCVVLVGNLTRDPELRHTGGGNPVVEFGLAVNSREKDKDGEWQDRADFFDVTVWGNQAENVDQYLHKGSKVAIDGRLRQDRWQDSNSGENRSKVKVIADTVQFLDPKDDGGNDQTDISRERATATSNRRAADEPPVDDIPFKWIDRFDVGVETAVACPHGADRSASHVRLR